MKTLKELEAIKYYEKGYAKARIILRDRKDVLGLIDEMHDVFGEFISVKDLKTEIEG